MAEATPKPTPPPEPQPEYESVFVVILGNAQEDFEITEQYNVVRFTDTKFDIEGIESITLEEVIASVEQEFTLYYFEAIDNVIQYRVYGKKYEMLTRTDVDGTITEFMATEPIEQGIYPVTITRDADGKLEFTVDPAASPIDIMAENFASDSEQNAEKKDNNSSESGSNSDRGSNNGGNNTSDSGTGVPASEAPVAQPDPEPTHDSRFDGQPPSGDEPGPGVNPPGMAIGGE
jgi:hypothetical protein